MHDWRTFVREHLDPAGLDDRRRERVVEELAGQLEDVHREALADGASDDEARARVLALVPDWRTLSSTISHDTRLHRRRSADILPERIAERMRRRGGPWRAVGHLSRDLRHTLRSVRLAPMFWAVTVPVLALGVAASTIVFSIADGVLLKTLPYATADRLVELLDPAFPAPVFEDWREHAASFELLAGYWEDTVDYVSGTTPERLTAGLVTPSFFALFEARPSHGRLFLPEDFDGPPHRAVLGHGAWQRLFGGDESAVGRIIELDGHATQVVGVLAPDFASPAGLAGGEADLWLALDPRWDEVHDPGIFILSVYGRLRDGVTHAAAQQEMDRLIARLVQERPEIHRTLRGEPRRVRVASLHDALVGTTATTVRLLMGAVLLLMLIACANVAHVFLARGTLRRHELAVRSALGAGGRRLAAQLLTESTTVALAGGLFGVLLAFAGVHAFRAFNPGDIPLVDRVTVDVRALAFAVALSLLTGVIFGLAPAWQAARAQGSAALRDTRRSGEPRDRSLLRNALVVTEIALSLSLLTGAGLLFRSFLTLRAVAPGFDVEHVAGVELSVGSRYTDAARRDLVARLLERAAGLPGVRESAVAWTAPFQYVGGSRVGWMLSTFQVDGEKHDVRTIIQPVTDRYFATLAARLRGSTWSRSDRDADVIPGVVSESFAMALFRSSDVVGRTFQWQGRGDDESHTVRVVGIVAGLHHWGLDQGDDPTVYVPWERLGASMPLATLLVRGDGDPAWLLADLRRAVWAEDPLMPLPETFTLSSRRSGSLVPPRFYTLMFGAFAVVAMALAAAGVYGAMLYSVGRRRHELGIRAALGAQRASLLSLVMRRSGALTLLGVVLGILASVLVNRGLGSLLFEVPPVDGATYAAAVVIVIAAALGAALGPAMRAATADPMEVIRTE